MTHHRGPRVYVVQRPAYRSRGEWVDKYDLSAAEEYGAMVYLLPPGNVSRDLTETMARLDHRLSDFFHDLDYMLAAGDPVAISAAVLRAAYFSAGPYVRLLKWDHRAQRYYPYQIPTGNKG